MLPLRVHTFRKWQSRFHDPRINLLSELAKESFVFAPAPVHRHDQLLVRGRGVRNVRKYCHNLTTYQFVSADASAAFDKTSNLPQEVLRMGIVLIGSFVHEYATDLQTRVLRLIKPTRIRVNIVHDSGQIALCKTNVNVSNNVGILVSIQPGNFSQIVGIRNWLRTWSIARVDDYDEVCLGVLLNAVEHAQASSV